LTGVGRSSLDALLANVIDPNQVIGKGYENVEVETRDGRSISGRLVETPTRGSNFYRRDPRKRSSRNPTSPTCASVNCRNAEGLEQMPDADFRNLILYVLNPPPEKGAPNQ